MACVCALLVGSCEAYLVHAMSVGTRTGPPQMQAWGRHSPAFGDNVWSRRDQLNAPTGASGMSKAKSSDAASRGNMLAASPSTRVWGRHSPAFGDNVWSRRDRLNAPTGMSSVRKAAGASRVGSSPPTQVWGRHSPAFGDNVWSRRDRLNALTRSSGVRETKVREATLRWYYETTTEYCDAFDPSFGDNAYAARARLFEPIGSVNEVNGALDGYPETTMSSESSFPVFSDTDARRPSFGSAEPQLALA